MCAEDDAAGARDADERVAVSLPEDGRVGDAVEHARLHALGGKEDAEPAHARPVRRD